MGRSFLMLLAAMLLLSQPTPAAVLTVYNLNNTAIAEYSTIAEAYNNAAEGDTLLVYPSELSYQAITITKKVFLTGGGYAAQTLFPATKLAGTVTFNAGSDGASVESFGGRFNIAINGANNILVSRCHINEIIIENSFNSLLTANLIDSQYGLRLNGNCLVEGSNNLLRAYMVVDLYGNSVLHMDNSIFWADGSIVINTHNQGTFSGKNNLLYGSISGNVDFHNSLQANPEYSFGHLDTVTTTKNNQIIPDIGVVFTDPAANDFTLKPGSPAFGNGENGSNISIYDGASPFVDGGFPKLPRIWFLDVPQSGSQTEGINVTIKVKSQN